MWGPNMGVNSVAAFEDGPNQVVAPSPLLQKKVLIDVLLGVLRGCVKGFRKKCEGECGSRYVCATS